MLNKKRKYKTAFTLVELLVAITIVMILSVVGAVTFTKASMKARNSKRQSDMQTVRQALVLYRADYGNYYDSVTGSPATDFVSAVNALRAGGYLSNDSITDPKGGVYEYLYVYDAVNDSFEVTARLEPENPPDYYTLSNL